MTGTLLTIFISVVLIETVSILLVWWSRSPWYRYAAGRAIMALLVAQSVILALALSTRLLGTSYLGRDILYLVGYTGLIIVMGWVGVTIIKAQTQDRNGGKG